MQSDQKLIKPINPIFSEWKSVGLELTIQIREGFKKKKKIVEISTKGLVGGFRRGSISTKKK